MVPHDGSHATRATEARVRELGITALMLTPIAFPLLWILGSTLSWCSGGPCEPVGYGAAFPAAATLSVLLAGAGLVLLRVGVRLGRTGERGWRCPPGHRGRLSAVGCRLSDVMDERLSGHDAEPAVLSRARALRRRRG